MFRKAVVVIHGFGGGVWENEFLVNYLQMDKKLDVYAFTLPGHKKEVVTGVKYQDWITYSENQVEKIIKDYKTVYVIGHSMGGIIAAHLASKYKQIKKLVLIAPAFEYGNLPQNIKDVGRLFKKNREVNKENLYKDVFVKMFRLPFPTMLEFKKLSKNYKDCIEKVTCTTLIMHGEIDELVPFSSSELAFNKINNKHKYLVKINKVRHRVFQSERKKIISEYIHKFLKGGIYKWKLKRTSKI